MKNIAFKILVLFFLTGCSDGVDTSDMVESAPSENQNFDRNTASGWLSAMTRDGIHGYELDGLRARLGDRRQSFEEIVIESYGGRAFLVKNHPSASGSGHRYFFFSTMSSSDNFDISFADVIAQTQRLGLAQGQRDSSGYWNWRWTSADGYRCNMQYRDHQGGQPALLTYRCEKDGYRTVDSMY